MDGEVTLEVTLEMAWVTAEVTSAVTPGLTKVTSLVTVSECPEDWLAIAAGRGEPEAGTRAGAGEKGKAGNSSEGGISVGEGATSLWAESFGRSVTMVSVMVGTCGSSSDSGRQWMCSCIQRLSVE